MLLMAISWHLERSLYISTQRCRMLICSGEHPAHGTTFTNWTLRLESTDQYIITHEVLYNGLTLILTIWRPFSTLQTMI